MYLVAGGRVRGDTVNPNLPRAIELLQKAHDWIPPNSGRMFQTAAFQLGVAQFQLGRQLDQQAETQRSCDAVRQVTPMWDQVATNIAAGAPINRDVANQILTAVPQFQSRAAAFARNFRCPG